MEDYHGRCPNQKGNKVVMHQKDRSLICRMAGNIAGLVYHEVPDVDVAQISVEIATRIVELVDQKIAQHANLVQGNTGG